MRRRKRNRKRIALILSAVSAAVSITYFALPPSAKTALCIGGGIDFSSEPESYAGEYAFDYFGIKDGEDEEEPAFTDSVYQEQEADKAEYQGPKPYPSEWKEDSETTVYPYTFERYSGEKFFALANGGQVMNETDISNGILLEESKALPDFSISMDGSPQVLIMHTHTTESFEPYEREHFDRSFSYRTTDPSKNVVAVGNEITRQLDDAGIGVIHDTTIHDYPSYNGSYERSAETVKGILEKYPTIKVVLDIHRDAVGTSDSIMQPTVNIKGKKAAQIMIISGCDDGTLDMPNYMKNYHFACLLQAQLCSDYSGLARPIMFDYRKYNQDLTTGSLLIEVGSHGNTLEQVKYSGELIGRSLAKALKSIKE